MPLNFLFIGVEPSFMAYFFTKDQALDASIDSCRTFQDAEKKLATTIYDVYFIDRDNSETAFLNLIHSIRDKAPSCIIAVISKSLMPEPVTGLIDYVLQKPIAPQQVDEVFTGLQNRFQRGSHSLTDFISLKDSQKELPIAYVVDPDRLFLDLLEKRKDAFAFNLEVESDPKKASERLKLKEFNPRILVIAESFPGYSLSAFDIIEEKRKEETHPFISALILNHESIDSRVKALENGINYVFHKPIYAYALLKSIKEALEIQSRQGFKVLILDDDLEFCHFVEEILKDAGIETCSLQDPLKLFSTLDEFKPQLLLLDLSLPKYDGLDLLKTLRHDSAYSRLNIVIITGGSESTTRLSAYSAKADDIIYKPIDPILFQKRIINFAERMVLPKDAETGMASLKEMTAKIHQCLGSEEMSSYFLVLFEIDRFNEWLETHGQTKAAALIISMNNQILLGVDSSRVCYHVQTAKYGIIFENEDLETVSQDVKTLLNQVIKKEALSSISFNCSITQLSRNYGHAEQNLKMGENALREASDKEKEPVKMVISSPEEKQKMQKELVLIDGDHQLLKILKGAFESHGIIATSFTDGEKALNDLLKRNAFNLPSLIIAERKLEDMDGIDILAKLKLHFKRPIPFYILTFFASDKDILEGIKQGALEYITKPFNTSILMEKALKTIYKDSN